MKKPHEERIAIIGGGMAGIVCAHALKAQGFLPVVLDKGRGLGGRLATRRAQETLTFDHGAQFMTARSTAFRDQIEQARKNKTMDEWVVRQGPASSRSHETWYVGTPNMNSNLKEMASGIEIHLSCELSSIRRSNTQWQLVGPKGNFGSPYDVVISTVPAPQARVLMATETDLIDSISNVQMAPCWALMFAFETSPGFDFDVWRSEEADISWIARNTSKPARSSHSECWVAHASPQWSQQNLELTNETAERLMLDALKESIGLNPSMLIYSAAHRWRYAKTLTPLGQPFVASQDRSLFVGGDWCLGSRVECAQQSGLAIAKTFLEQRSPKELSPAVP